MRIAHPPAIDGAPVVLRPLELTDADDWYAYLRLPRTVEHTSWSLSGVDDLRPLLAWYDSSEPASAIRFAICAADDGRLIGTIGFHSISLPHGTAELAYDLDPAHWGRGVATACVRPLVAWGFARQRYVRIQATTVDTNAASVRVLERCGFEREGLLRSYRRVAGTPRDFWMYARLAPERSS